jgi:hypothetical protein
MHALLAILLFESIYEGRLANAYWALYCKKYGIHVSWEYRKL